MKLTDKSINRFHDVFCLFICLFVYVSVGYGMFSNWDQGSNA